MQRFDEIGEKSVLNKENELAINVIRIQISAPANETNVSKSSVLRILYKHKFRAYHIYLL